MITLKKMYGAWDCGFPLEPKLVTVPCENEVEAFVCSCPDTRLVPEPEVFDDGFFELPDDEELTFVPLERETLPLTFSASSTGYSNPKPPDKRLSSLLTACSQ